MVPRRWTVVPILLNSLSEDSSDLYRYSSSDHTSLKRDGSDEYDTVSSLYLNNYRQQSISTVGVTNVLFVSTQHHSLL